MGWFWKMFTSVTVPNSQCAIEAEFEDYSDDKLFEVYRKYMNDNSEKGTTCFLAAVAILDRRYGEQRRRQMVRDRGLWNLPNGMR